VQLIEDTKRKYTTELKKRETEFEDEKHTLEQQIEELRTSLKKERYFHVVIEHLECIVFLSQTLSQSEQWSIQRTNRKN
jgi:hypothetical protein